MKPKTEGLKALPGRKEQRLWWIQRSDTVACMAGPVDWESRTRRRLTRVLVRRERKERPKCTLGRYDARRYLDSWTNIIGAPFLLCRLYTTRFLLFDSHRDSKHAGAKVARYYGRKISEGISHLVKNVISNHDLFIFFFFFFFFFRSNLNTPAVATLFAGRSK